MTYFVTILSPQIQLYFLLISFFCLSFSYVLGDVKGENGLIKFDINSDNQEEMILNSTGLGIGATPSTNLEVNGNAIVQKIVIGNNSSSNDNLHISGTQSFSSMVLSGNQTIAGNHSFYLIDGQNSELIIYLPNANQHEGKVLNLKNLSNSGNALISATSPIDTFGDIKLDAASSVKLFSYSGNWLILNQNGTITQYSGINNNLQSYFHFQDDTEDQTTNNNNGTISGTTYASAVTSNGAIGNGLSFDGVDDLITVSDNNSLDLSNTGTIAFWVKPSGNTVSHGTFSGWTERTALLNPNHYDDPSQVSFIQGGNTIYYAAFTHVSSTEYFELGTSDEDFNGLTWSNAPSEPGGAGNDEATSITIETDGNMLYYLAMAQSGFTESYYYASSNLDFSNFSGWDPKNDPDGSGARDPSYTDAILVDQQIHLVAFMNDQGTGNISLGSSNIDGSGDIDWTSVHYFASGDDVTGAAEAASPAIDSDGETLYYAFFSTDIGNEDFFTATSNLDGSNFILSSEQSSPNEDTNNRGTHMDMTIAGGKLHYATILASVDDNKIFVYTAYSDLGGGNLSAWTNRGAVRDSITGGGDLDSLSIDIESNGANLQLLAYSGNQTSSNIVTSEIELPSAPLLNKESAYTLHYTGGGFVFEWDGRSISFGDIDITDYTHVAVTHDGTQLIFYINGQEVRRQTTTTDFSIETSNLTIGGDGTRYFEGDLDEIRIYDSALTPSEVQGLYNIR